MEMGTFRKISQVLVKSHFFCRKHFTGEKKNLAHCNESLITTIT